MRNSPYSPEVDQTTRYRIIDGTSSILYEFHAKTVSGARKIASRFVRENRGYYRGLGTLWLLSFDRAVDERILR